MDFEEFANNDLPHSLEAEQSVLGSILVEPSIISTVLEYLTTKSFYIEKHVQIFDIMLQMFTSNQTANAITVLDEAIRRKVFETKEEGRNYLAYLANSMPSVEVSNVESYCKIVAEKQNIRNLAITARDILHEIALNQSSSQTMLDAAEQKLFEIRQGKDITGLTPISDVVFESWDRLQKISGPDKDKYLGAKSGFTLLDTVTSGLNKSDLIILAARPGMGKTSFALNIASNVARHSGKEVAIFSLEMSKEQLATRMLSSEALVDSNKLRNGHLSDNDWVRLASGADILCNLPITLDDTAGTNVPQIKSKLRRVKNLGLVVIDYLQLLGSTMKTENMVLRVQEITRNLKILAKELDVPVILLSQLSRAVEGRPDKRPLLSDLRDSGSIEQDADIVLFLYREGYYNKETANPNICECIVAKNRHGETGPVKLIWDGQFTRFSNADFTSDPPPEA